MKIGGIHPKRLICIPVPNRRPPPHCVAAHMMSDSEPTKSDLSPDGKTTPRFQFSLAWLLVAMTAVAVVLAISQTVLGKYIIAAVVSSVVGGIVPAALVIVALFGRGELRVFSIGALVPWVASRPVIRVPMDNSLWLPIVGQWAYTLITAAVCGGVAVVVYRWIQRRGEGN